MMKMMTSFILCFSSCVNNKVMPLINFCTVNSSLKSNLYEISILIYEFICHCGISSVKDARLCDLDFITKSSGFLKKYILYRIH